MKTINVTDDLAVAIGNQSVQVSPGEALRLAERLIRRATVRMIVEESKAASATAQPARTLDV